MSGVELEQRICQETAPQDPRDWIAVPAWGSLGVCLRRLQPQLGLIRNRVQGAGDPVFWIFLHPPRPVWVVSGGVCAIRDQSRVSFRPRPLPTVGRWGSQCRVAVPGRVSGKATGQVTLSHWRPADVWTLISSFLPHR